MEMKPDMGRAEERTDRERSMLLDAFAAINLQRVFFASVFFCILVPVICSMLIREAAEKADLFYVMGMVQLLFSAVCAGISFGLLRRRRTEYYGSAVSVCSMLQQLFLAWFAWQYLLLSGSLTGYYVLLAFSALVVLQSTKRYLITAGLEWIFFLAMSLQYPFGTLQYAGAVLAQLAAFFIAFQMYRSVYETLRLKQVLRREKATAESDPLTGLKNRRGLERQVKERWQSCERSRKPVAAMMLDIDNFKKYNDKFGHPQGDECLKRVAEAISRTAEKKNGVAARIGGEEFMVFVQGSSEEELYRLAKDIRAEVEALQIEQAAGLVSKVVTVSVGLAIEYASENVSFEGLYKKADAELYYAKQRGRNCISCNKRNYKEWEQEVAFRAGRQ